MPSAFCKTDINSGEQLDLMQKIFDDIPFGGKLFRSMLDMMVPVVRNKTEC
jgi:hypothetical protein